MLKSSGLGVRGWDYSSLGQVLGFRREVLRRFFTGVEGLYARVQKGLVYSEKKVYVIQADRKQKFQA